MVLIVSLAGMRKGLRIPRIACLAVFVSVAVLVAGLALSAGSAAAQTGDAASEPPSSEPLGDVRTPDGLVDDVILVDGVLDESIDISGAFFSVAAVARALVDPLGLRR